MTSGLSIAPPDRPALRIVETEPSHNPLSTLGSIAVENIAEFWMGGPENRRRAELAADENLAAFRSSK